MEAKPLQPRSASAKDLMEIQLELNQVSALAPQLQARVREVLLAHSLLQVATVNPGRGLITRGQGQQQRSPFWGLPSCFFPSPFHS